MLYVVSVRHSDCHCRKSQAGLINERTLTDLLRETLYGRNGVESEPKLLQEFFTLAARTLIQQKPQLAALDITRKRKLAAFLGFAFATCPESGKLELSRLQEQLQEFIDALYVHLAIARVLVTAPQARAYL